MIIGQGLAGSLLAYELLQRGGSVDVVNKTDRHCSSYVAAGLYNPITGRKMIKTWNADKVFPTLEHYYRDLELHLGAGFLYPSQIYRPFMAMEEQNEWQGRIADGNYNSMIEELTTGQGSNPDIHDQYGGLRLKNAGYVDVGALLDACRQYFVERDSYYEAVFQEEDMQIRNEAAIWKDRKYGHVVYCQGQAVRNNPHFNWLPLRPVKGEILDVDIAYNERFILNRGVFLLPSSAHRPSRLGSTYDNHRLDHQPTEKAIEYLREKLGMIFAHDFRIVKHIAGIRPATKDRKPLIGTHPAIKELSIFNGFGTKGVSLAVYYAKQFANHLQGNGLIDDEVNIQRFMSLYPN